MAFTAGASLAFYYGIFGGGFDPDPRGFAAIVVWAAIAIGLAVGLFPATRLPRGWQTGVALLTGLAAWTALSALWGDSTEKTFIEVTRVLHYAGIVVLVWLTVDRHSLSAAAGGVFAGAFVITGLALASRLIPDAFPVPDFAQVGGTVGDARRLEYPFGYWNALGAWASMTAAMGIAWAAHARLPLLRVAAAATVPVAGAVVYLTYSRGGAVGFVLGMTVAVLASRRRWSAGLIAAASLAGTAVAVWAIRDQPEIAEALGSAGAGIVALGVAGGAAIAGLAVLGVMSLRIDRWRVGEDLAKDAAAIAVAVVAFFGLMAVASGFAGDVWDRVGASPENASVSPARSSEEDTGRRLLTFDSARPDIYDAAFDGYTESAPLGLGAGNFEFWWARHPTVDAYVVDAHSLYIESLAELGPVGLVLIVGVLGWLGWMAIMARRDSHSERRSGAVAGAIGALAVFVVQAGAEWFWEYAGLVALALGSAAIAACGRSGSRKGRRIPGAWRVALVSVAGVMVIAQALPWLSVRGIRASEDAIAAGDPARAVDEAENARDLESWAARPHAQLARARAAAGDLGAAASELREAIDREPLNWRYRAQLAGLERAAGNAAAADSAYHEAERRYRLNPSAIDFVAVEMEQLASR